MEPTKGKLTNKESKETLNFSINPSDFTLSQSFGYHIEPCLGQPAPMVAFKSGDGATLNFQLAFDKDADKDVDPSKVKKFLHGLNKVDEQKKSTPLVEFSYGSFQFTGYVTKYVFHPVRFTGQGDVDALTLDMTLLSDGTYEEQG